jgi:coenzyme F420-reducing hydrogenase delta subunit/DNA-binding transcriptional ArsR family regulator
MCSGRVDLEFILRAFSNGQDGVFIGGCKLGECNYITQGNFDALSNTHICKKIMEHIGLNPERLRIAFMSSADGQLLAEVTDDFAGKVRELGPIGKGEGIDEDLLKFNLEAARKLVPYIRLVERERLRIPKKSEEDHNKYFNSDEVNDLFNDLIGDKLAISQIMLLLGEKPLPTGQIAEKLDLSPSDVSRHMNTSSRHGLVRYDRTSNCYGLA